MTRYRNASAHVRQHCPGCCRDDADSVVEEQFAEAEGEKLANHSIWEQQDATMSISQCNQRTLGRNSSPRIRHLCIPSTGAQTQIQSTGVCRQCRGHEYHQEYLLRQLGLPNSSASCCIAMSALAASNICCRVPWTTLHVTRS
jgi:hypothetical protein